MNAKMIMSQLNERRSIAWALGLRIELLSPATCSWVQQEAARRAGSLADNTEVDVESVGDRARGYRKLNDEKLIEPQRDPRARRDTRSN